MQPGAVLFVLWSDSKRGRLHIDMKLGTCPPYGINILGSLKQEAQDRGI
jgi:hypothetical protein